MTGELLRWNCLQNTTLSCSDVSFASHAITVLIACEAILSKAPIMNYSKYQFGNTCITKPILKVCLHLICFSALPKPASEPVPAMRIYGVWCVYTIIFAHNLAMASGIRLPCFTEKEKCNHVKHAWKNGSTGSAPTRARFIEKVLAKAKEDTLAVSKHSHYLRRVLQSIPLCTLQV